MSIDAATHRDALVRGLAKSIRKPGRKDGRTSTGSAVITDTAAYYAGSVASDSGVLDCPSEEVALAMAVHANDFRVAGVVTLAEAAPDVSPLVLKVLVDHARRIGRDFGYEIVDADGASLFRMSTRDMLPFYEPPGTVLAKAGGTPLPNVVAHGRLPEDVAPLLKEAALEGIGRNFPNYDSASGYGAAVLTQSGVVYLGGQYSTPEKRLGMHAEMSVVVGCMMAVDSPIRALGLVSSKHETVPCMMCGCCRQFLQELFAKAGIDPVLHFFAKETDAARTVRFSEFHVDSWTSTRA